MSRLSKRSWTRSKPRSTNCRPSSGTSSSERCQKHAKANACRQVRKREREEFSKDLNRVFYTPNEAAARAAFFEVKDRWGEMFPLAVQFIEMDLDSLLTFSSSTPCTGPCCELCIRLSA